MNISLDKTHLSNALSGINSIFKDLIIDNYIEIKKRQVKSNFNDEFDTVGISSGKFCETMFRFLENEIFGKFTPFDKHISNFPSAIEKLTQAPKDSAIDSIRVIIPRSLNLIYTLRNKRGIGHVGGDVSANEIDISTIVKNIDWIICELIRIYHKLGIDEAQQIINSLNIKFLPDIWNIEEKRRIIKDGLKFNEAVLVILYNEINNSAHWKNIFEWVEYSSASVFKSKVLFQLHKNKNIEFNQISGLVTLSPKGMLEAEKILFKYV